MVSTYPKREELKRIDGYIRNDNISDEMTWSEMSSSLSTINLLHDSYHSNSLTGDSGVDCPEIPIGHHQYSDDEHELILKRTDTQPTSELSTEKGLERALEQTSRFYTDLEHIATDLESLTKRYSRHSSHRSIDALDWDLTDDLHSPKTRKLQQQLIRSNNKNKIRRKLNTNIHQTEYHESDNDHRIYDYSTSPLRRKHSSVYFDSSDEDNSGDETLQIN